MSDEPIRDRLRRLRRGPQETACSSSAPEHAGEIVRDLAASPARESQAGASGPSATDAHLDRADTSTFPATADTERATIFSRLSRRSKAADSARVDFHTVRQVERAGSAERRVQPRELSLDPPRDLVQSARGTCARTLTFERAHRHGSFALDELFATSCTKLAELARDERIAGVDLERAVFFDTETTGLSGGAGTYVFLVGMGRFIADRFELWQGFLPHPADERSLLEEVAERIADASAILSFFGKSFDRHRLEDKMRLHGITPPFESSIHLDLYYPLRRAHRGKFENCRLKTLERELAGVQRADDLPGSFAPAAWFDFLARRPHQLEGVFRHNADDVLSLVALATHLGRGTIPACGS